MTEETKKYIIVKAPSINVGYLWTLNDSLNGIVYDSFARAYQECLILNGTGVVEINSPVKGEEIK